MSQTIEVELDEAREVMFDQLSDQIGEETVEEVLEDAVNNQLTELWDQRDQI